MAQQLFALPAYAEFNRFRSHNPLQADAGFQIYLELVNAKQWPEVQVKHCEELQLSYIAGRRTQTAPVEFVVPVCAGQSLSMSRVYDLLRALYGADSGNRSLTVAILDSDSTSVFYQVAAGIVAPAEFQKFAS